MIRWCIALRNVGVLLLGMLLSFLLLKYLLEKHKVCVCVCDFRQNKKNIMLDKICPEIRKVVQI